MKFSIKWNKAPPSGIAGKLEYFDIELRQNYGLLEDDYAQVKSHFSYQTVKKGKFFPETENHQAQSFPLCQKAAQVAGANRYIVSLWSW